MDQDEIIVAVRDQQMRPTLPSWTPGELSSFISLCWNERADRRPTMQGVLRFLSEMKVSEWAAPKNEDPSMG